MNRYDGVTEALAHYTLHADDEDHIYVVNKGCRYGPKDVIDRIINGEEVPEGPYYFKTVPSFETGSKKNAFLNRNIFVGEGLRRPSQVQIQFYQVL
ncbi:DUF3237 domain-containing protein [Bacillus sp. M6-12]|uniref:DUF3237 family protein n=1 Tax=Bacillus sp. M6-12 TaxID=2054166 RepID=UPI000C78DA9B|nr:DUF3237 family protein [Bacillus sp. M6-12]PLS18628.1 DUF3237 domain-containing protein [Bacillus sp. M6-12]